MEPIKNDNRKDDPLERLSKTQKRVVKSLFNNMALIIGMFIIIVVIVVFTTDVKISSALHWAEIGLTFFILLFCSYSMYVNFVGSGTRAGKATKIYIETLEKYETIKKKIIDNKHQNRIGEFCRYYISEELKNTKNSILSEVGIDFEDYTEKYIGKDEETLQTDENLSKAQIAAICKANSIQPVKLTPEMIFKRGRGDHRRSPLGIKPETRKNIAYGTKFIYTCVTSLLTGIILFDVIIDPSWATFAACCLKVLLVVLNGFFGYKMGFENITVHTVDYMSDQIDLMQQLEQYIESHPEIIKIEDDIVVETSTEETSTQEKQATLAEEVVYDKITKEEEEKSSEAIEEKENTKLELLEIKNVKE